MIRINLLAEGRRPVVARKAKPKISLGDQDPGNLILLAGLILAVLVTLGWWYRLNSEFRAVEARVRQAQAEYDKLAPIIAEVDEFKAMKEDLDTKIEVIKELKRQRTGPVSIMDNVSRALPDLLWLDQMNVIGSTVTMRGKAFNTNAVATFIENLDKVPEFREPDTRNVVADGNRGTYTFQLSFQFVQPMPEDEEAEEGEVAL